MSEQSFRRGVWIVSSYLHEAAFKTSNFLPQSANIRLAGYSNLPTGMSVWLNDVRASYRKWLALWGICKMKLRIKMIAYASKKNFLPFLSFEYHLEKHLDYLTHWMLENAAKSFIFQWANPDCLEHVLVNSNEQYCAPPLHTPRVSAVLRVMLSWLPEMGRLFLRGDSFASGPVSVRKGPTAPQGWALSWTAAAAARVVPGRSESRATRGTSVTPTKACTATSQLTSPDMRSGSVRVSDFPLFLKFLWRQNAFLLSFF